MLKINSITSDQFEKLKKTRNKVKAFKVIIGIDPQSRYSIGDTFLDISTLSNVNQFDIYKNTFAGRDVYYLITEVLDKNIAEAWSFY